MSIDVSHTEPRDNVDPRDRVDPDSVLGRLFRDEEAMRFDFFQAVRLLECLLVGGTLEHTDARTLPIQFRPDTALAFPATDVKRLEWVEAAVARITVTFMGLYGIGSPLPFYFCDEISKEMDEAEALKDFLDVFNQRLYRMFYESWKKYRPALHFEQTYRNAHTQVFLSLAGLGTPGLEAGLPLPPLHLVPFAGRLGGHVRYAEGLQALLADLLAREDIAVRIEENVPRWVPVANRPGLGGDGRAPAILGVTAIVGASIYDVSGKFRVVLGPLSFRQYRCLLPGEGEADRVHALVRLYAPDYLDYDVELLLDTSGVPQVKLGDPTSRIGVDAWLGRPSGAVISKVVAYA